MVFNAAVGNVDDHLKNFWMLAKPQGDRLAPAFDLVPHITGRAEHTLSFRSSFACPTRNKLMAIAREWSVDAADDIVSQVIKAVRTFAATAKQLAVHGAGSLATITNDVGARLKTIGA